MASSPTRARSAADPDKAAPVSGRQVCVDRHCARLTRPVASRLRTPAGRPRGRAEGSSRTRTFGRTPGGPAVTAYWNIDAIRCDLIITAYEFVRANETGCSVAPGSAQCRAAYTRCADDAYSGGSTSIRLLTPVPGWPRRRGLPGCPRAALISPPARGVVVWRRDPDRGAIWTAGGFSR